MSDSFIWTLLGHLVCIAQWAAFILVDYAYLGRGRRFRHPCVWAALLALAVLALSVLCGFGFFNIKSVVSNIIYLLVIALLFGGTAVDRMSACIINGILCLLTENTVSFVFARLHGICPGEVWRYRTCLAALVISILLVGILVARFLCRWNHCSALDPLQALLMSFFPGVVVLLNIFIMISSNRRVPTLLDLMLTVGLTIAVLVHLAIVQMFNDQVVQGQASHFQAALEQQRAEALMESYTAQRRLTHEFTNHIAALDALLRQGDLTGAQEYLSSVSKVVAAGTTILDTHNPLLDSLLSRKYEEAAQQGVELYFDLCDLKDLPFCGTDLVIVISNLLDNAIRAAAQARGESSSPSMSETKQARLSFSGSGRPSAALVGLTCLNEAAQGRPVAARSSRTVSARREQGNFSHCTMSMPARASSRASSGLSTSAQSFFSGRAARNSGMRRAKARRASGASVPASSRKTRC